MASSCHFSSVDRENFPENYLTPKIFDYKELLSGQDSTLKPSMRCNYHWRDDAPSPHLKEGTYGTGGQR
jgi:hypothetical protein